jgi:hypothetical protein
MEVVATGLTIGKPGILVKADLLLTQIAEEN